MSSSVSASEVPGQQLIGCGLRSSTEGEGRGRLGQWGAGGLARRGTTEARWLPLTAGRRAGGAVPLEARGDPLTGRGCVLGVASHGSARLSVGAECFSPPRSVEGEYVPVEGDEVTYKMCSIPPKHEKLQAVEVVITHLAPGTKHETWSGHVVSS